MGCAILLALAWSALGRGSRRAWSAVAVSVPVVTGFTRLALGVRFLSDVIGSRLIAAALFAGMALLLRRIRRIRCEEMTGFPLPRWLV